MREEWFESLKGQLNIDFDEKDGELRHLLETAEAYCLDESNCTREEMTAQGGGEDYPLMFCQAVIILAKHWYETGGTMTVGSVRENPMGFWMLLNRFKREI